VLSGEVDLMFNGLSPAVPHIHSGRVRALAVGSEKRTALFPELPTIQEAGYEFKTGGWYGVLTPRGTPKPVVDTLLAAVVKTMEQASVRAALTKIVTEPVVGTPQGFADLISYESALWGKVIKAAGIKVD